MRSFAVIIQHSLIVWGPLIARSSAAQKIDQIRLGGRSPRTLFCWRGGNALQESAPNIMVVVAMFFSILSFPTNDQQVQGRNKLRELGSFEFKA